MHTLFFNTQLPNINVHNGVMGTVITTEDLSCHSIILVSINLFVTLPFVSVGKNNHMVPVYLYITVCTYLMRGIFQCFCKFQKMI